LLSNERMVPPLPDFISDNFLNIFIYTAHKGK